MGRIREFFNKLNPIQPDIAASDTVSSAPFVHPKVYEFPNEIGIVKRCIEIICDAGAEIPIKFYESKDGTLIEKPNTQLARFLNSPNDHYDATRFYCNLIEDLIVDGNAYIIASKTGLYHMPARFVEIVEDKQNFVKGYRYTANGAYKLYDPNTVIHIRLNNNTSVYKGVGKLDAIKNELIVYQKMISYQDDFFLNSALPKVILKTANFLSPKAKAKMLADWKAAHNSLRNKAHGTAILDGGLETDILDTTFKDLDFNEGITRLDKYIAVILGVPWVLLHSGNNANIRPNERVFYYHTVIPIMNRIASAIEFHVKKLNPTLKGKVIIKPDTFNVEALRPDMKEFSSYLSTLVNGGILTPNEARKELRRPKLEGLDEIRVPANIAGSAVDPSTGGKPSGDDTDKN